MIVRAIDTLYQRLALPVAGVLLAASTLFSTKARDRQVLSRETRDLSPLPAPRHRRIWMHAASMGEFEQLVPVIDELRAHDVEIEIIVTVTSPSGLRHARNTKGVNAAYILPFDRPKDMQRWFETILPSIIVIDRYDVWRTMILEADARNIPVVVINATTPTGSRIPAVRPWFADTYCLIDSITAVTEQDAAELRALTGRVDIEYDSDTRVDRVLKRLSSPDEDILSYRTAGQKTLIIGSSWPEDEDLLIESLHGSPDLDLRCIIVPHEPTESALTRIEQRLPCTRWSRSTSTTPGHLLVDSVGKLLSLYAIADAAFVGGGFGAGVHSVTEPAGYELPICSGPRIERSRDAVDLQRAEVLTVVENAKDLTRWLRSVVFDPLQRSYAQQCAHDYIESHRGSARRYAQKIIERW